MFNLKPLKLWQDFAEVAIGAVLGAVLGVVTAVAIVLAVVASVCKLMFNLNFQIMLKKVNWTRVLTEIVLLIAAVLGGAYNAETITNLL